MRIKIALILAVISNSMAYEYNPMPYQDLSKPLTGLGIYSPGPLGVKRVNIYSQDGNITSGNIYSDPRGRTSSGLITNPNSNKSFQVNTNIYGQPQIQILDF